MLIKICAARAFWLGLLVVPLLLSCSGVRPALLTSGLHRLTSDAAASQSDPPRRWTEPLQPRFEAPTRATAVAGAAAVVDASPGWGQTLYSTDVWAAPSLARSRRGTLPTGSRVEILDGGPNGSLLVRYPGDGRTPPGSGWIEGRAIGRTAAPEPEVLPRAYPAITDANVIRLKVPYQTQLDGSPWAESNCGPTSLSMALETFGVEASSARLRTDTLNAQGMWGDEAGTLLDALATVAEGYGVQVHGLYEGQRLRQWSVADVREQIERGRPVIAQVRFRALPERETSLYWGDHYIVITGVMNGSFIYHDPIDSDGVGYDRLISADGLRLAMNASDRRYSYAAFALSK